MTFLRSRKVWISAVVLLCLLAGMLGTLAVLAHRPHLTADAGGADTPMLDAVTLSGLYGDSFHRVSFTLSHGTLTEHFSQQPLPLFGADVSRSLLSSGAAAGAQHFFPLLAAAPGESASVRYETAPRPGTAAEDEMQYLLRITEPDRIRILSGAGRTLRETGARSEVLADTGLSFSAAEFGQRFGFRPCFVQLLEIPVSNLENGAVPDFYTSEDAWRLERSMLWDADHLEFDAVSSAYYSGSELQLSDPVLCPVAASADCSEVLFFPAVQGYSGTVPVLCADAFEDWAAHAFGSLSGYGSSVPVAVITPEAGSRAAALAVLENSRFLCFCVGEGRVSAHLYSAETGQELDRCSWESPDVPHPPAEVQTACTPDGAVLCLNRSFYVGVTAEGDALLPTAAETAPPDNVPEPAFAAAQNGILYRFSPERRRTEDGGLYTGYAFTAYGPDGTQECIRIRTPTAEDQLMLERNPDGFSDMRRMCSIFLEGGSQP